MNVHDDSDEPQRTIIIEASQSECDALAGYLAHAPTLRWYQLVHVLRGKK